MGRLVVFEWLGCNLYNINIEIVKYIRKMINIEGFTIKVVGSKRKKEEENY